MSDYEPQPGHRVEAIQRLIGTLEHSVFPGVIRLRTEDGALVMYRLDDPSVTFTRLLDPEPDWQRGDVAKDAEGRIVARTSSRYYPWLWLNAPNATPDGADELTDDNLVRPLIPIVLNGETVTS